MNTQATFEALESRQLMAATLGTNLIVNGDAEASVGTTGINSVPLPGWQTSTVTPVKYGSPDGFPSATSPGPKERGLNFFGGGVPKSPNALPGAHQEIDVSALASDIDNSYIQYDFSAWLGGYLDQPDQMEMRIAFFDASDKQIDFHNVIGPSTSDRGGVTGFAFKQTTGTMPAGTRRVGIDLIASRSSGGYADGYADNVSLVLTSTANAKTGTIYGGVFDDVNTNGKPDAADKLVPGVTVYVDKNNNGKLDKNEPSAKTDKTGVFTLENAPKGDVILREIVPASYRTVTPAALKVNVPGGLTTPPQLFGLTQSVKIGGTVFADTNGNGKRDKNELGMLGLTVFLDLNDNGELDAGEASTMTNANGNYSFVTKHGKYNVRVDHGAGYKQTTPKKNGALVVKLAKGTSSMKNLFGLKAVG